jgi:hypothetical protein
MNFGCLNEFLEYLKEITDFGKRKVVDSSGSGFDPRLQPTTNGPKLGGSLLGAAHGHMGGGPTGPCQPTESCAHAAWSPRPWLT